MRTSLTDFRFRVIKTEKENTYHLFALPPRRRLICVSVSEAFLVYVGTIFLLASDDFQRLTHCRLCHFSINTGILLHCAEPNNCLGKLMVTAQLLLKSNFSSPQLCDYTLGTEMRGKPKHEHPHLVKLGFPLGVGRCGFLRFPALTARLFDDLHARSPFKCH